MSQSGNEALDEGSDEPQNVSVLDILYCDSRRVGAFLSQFDDLGVATKVSVSESVQKARGRSFKFGASGGLPGVGNASLSIERGPTSIGGANAEARDYDPIWTNALALLDYLESNDLIVRDVSRARIGQFLIGSGTLAIMDLTLFKGIWSLPAIRDLIRQNQDGNVPVQPMNVQNLTNRQRKEVQKQQREETKDPQAALIESALAVVSMLPHSVQIRLTTSAEGAVLWSSLKDEAMLISAPDLVLKHGIAVAGDWSMIGILDALPDSDASGTLTTDGMLAALQATALGDSPFGQMMFGMMPLLRPLLGRPFTAHGVTPLLIYRAVSG